MVYLGAGEVETLSTSCWHSNHARQQRPHDSECLLLTRCWVQLVQGLDGLPGCQGVGWCQLTSAGWLAGQLGRWFCFMPSPGLFAQPCPPWGHRKQPGARALRSYCSFPWIQGGGG